MQIPNKPPATITNKAASGIWNIVNRTLGDWYTKPVGLKLNPGAKAYHGRPFPIPHVHLQVLKREMKRLVELGVLIKQPNL